jgi:hypothetical protein
LFVTDVTAKTDRDCRNGFRRIDSVVGYPAEGAEVPMISKKPLEEIATFV